MNHGRIAVVRVFLCRGVRLFYAGAYKLSEFPVFIRPFVMLYVILGAVSSLGGV